MIDQRGTSIEYQAKTKHLNLMYLISQTRNRSLREKYTRQATAIRYYIRALRFKDYLTDQQVNQIYQCLIDLADLYEFPVNPNLPTVEPPQQGTTTIIVGTPGPSGDDGGGTDYSALNIVTDTTVDEFPTNIAYAAEWTYDISDSSGNGRSGRVSAKWNSSAGTISAAVEYGSLDLGVDTSPVIFQTAIVSGNVRLIALVASGTWTVRGTRYLTPNGGVLQVTPSVLASGNILVGNASNAATSVALSGDGTISNTGVFAISTGVIVNADVNTSAAIAWSKLATDTASRVAVTSAGGVLTTSSITTTILGYLSNVTSDIQAQIDALSSGTFNGAVSTILTSNLTTDRVLISNPAGKVAVSGVSVTNLNTLDTTTSLTTQLGAKVPISSATTTTIQVGSGADILYTRFVPTSDWVELESIYGLMTLATASGVVFSRTSSYIFSSFQFATSNGAAATPHGLSIQIKGGDAFAGNNNGANVRLTPGTATGSGTPGYLIIDNLPTSSAGLPSGAVWKDSGTLKIV